MKAQGLVAYGSGKKGVMQRQSIYQSPFSCAAAYRPSARRIHGLPVGDNRSSNFVAEIL